MRKKILEIKDSKPYKMLDYIVFGILFMASIAAMSVLFYRQATTTNEGVWPSDTYSYIEEILGINTTYYYPYPIMFMLGRFVNALINSPEWSIVITAAIFNGIAIIVSKIIITHQTGSRLLSTGTTIGLFFVSMIFGSIFVKVGIPNRNTGVFTPNPWYNQTYMAARPFMIMAFILGVKTLTGYEDDFKPNTRLSTKKILMYICFSVVMLLSTMAKPSYTIVHMGAVGLIMIFRLCKNKWKTFRQTLFLGFCYVPTIIDLLYQYISEFTGGALVGEEQGIGIGIFRVWGKYSDNIPLALVLAGAFPLAVLIIHRKEIKSDTQYRFSWQIYLVGLIMALILYEKGYSESHCNFMWGYECGLFMVFFCGVIKMLTDTMDVIKAETSMKRALLLIVEWVLLALHTIMGLYYFYLLTAYGINYR